MIPVVGSMAMAIGYTVVMGWILKYAIGAFSGTTLAPEHVDDFADKFGSMASAFGNNGWQVLILCITMAILMFGVGNGIETANKIMMPIFFFCLLDLAFISHFNRGRQRVTIIFSY